MSPAARFSVKRPVPGRSTAVRRRTAPVRPCTPSSAVRPTAGGSSTAETRPRTEARVTVPSRWEAASARTHSRPSRECSAM